MLKTHCVCRGQGRSLGEDAWALACHGTCGAQRTTCSHLNSKLNNSLNNFNCILVKIYKKVLFV